MPETLGNVSNPAVVGFGGWQVFKFLFAGRNAAVRTHLRGRPGWSAVIVRGHWNTGQCFGSGRCRLRWLAGVQVSVCRAGTPSVRTASTRSTRMVSCCRTGRWNTGQCFGSGRCRLRWVAGAQVSVRRQERAGQDRIYAVDQDGQLLSYGDAGTPGNVSDPVVVGFGGVAGAQVSVRRQERRRSGPHLCRGR